MSLMRYPQCGIPADRVKFSCSTARANAVICSRMLLEPVRNRNRNCRNSRQGSRGPAGCVVQRGTRLAYLIQPYVSNNLDPCDTTALEDGLP
jgi:hypothetical protein